MARNWYDLYNYVWNEISDTRTRNMCFFSTPWPLLIIFAVYLYSALYAVPRYMRNRNPYSLKYFIRCYNIFQIVSNFWLSYGILTSYVEDPTKFCVDEYDSEMQMNKITTALWWAMILKLIDLVETIVFALRKKDRQISFLHLYHHISTIIFAFVTVKWLPSDVSKFFVLLNSIVHVIMYTYYLLSTFGRSISRHIHKIKPMITSVQMIQFIIMLIYTVYIMNLSTCQPYWTMAVAMFMNLTVNFVLFYNFYRKNYAKTKTG